MRPDSYREIAMELTWGNFLPLVSIHQPRSRHLVLVEAHGIPTVAVACLLVFLGHLNPPDPS